MLRGSQTHSRHGAYPVILYILIVILSVGYKLGFFLITIYFIYFKDVHILTAFHIMIILKY